MNRALSFLSDGEFVRLCYRTLSAAKIGTYSPTSDSKPARIALVHAAAVPGSGSP
jgi:hypothetical protein